jgi:hypothetical protein
MEQLPSSCSSAFSERPPTAEPRDAVHRKRSKHWQESDLQTLDRQYKPEIDYGRAAISQASSQNNTNADSIKQYETNLKILSEDPDSRMVPQDSLLPYGGQRWPGIALQPEFSPISQEQLAAEVKGIYAGLVMVEAKCINIDLQKSSQPHDELSTEQWQALVALHRTVLYQHLDFLMASQHPSANSALLGLANEHSMPARIWKYGIYAFLELLRHRRPHSQEYMLAFIYLAYQMMSLLLETVPAFTDAWIECLGDLARYRMAIEEDREIHATWAGVAGRWYVKAADRNPNTGRLYHHSGILERPSLRKLYLYGRALTSVEPFPNAKESLNTLYTPIVEDEQALRKGSESADALVTCFHARSFLSQSTELVDQASSAALKLLETQSEDSMGTIGVPLAVTNIAAMLEFGSPKNIYRQLYDTVLNRDNLDSRTSRGNSSAPPPSSNFTLLGVDKAQRPADIALDFCYHSFNSIIRRTPRSEDLPGLLPHVHVMLVFIKSLFTLRSRLCPDDNATDTLNDILSTDRLDWSALASFLNHTAKSFPIPSRTESSATDETFPTDGIPLLEDYMMRGLVWAQWYFAPDWFKNIEDDDGSRCLEDECKTEHRATRVLYLGMTLASVSAHLRYDRETRQFSRVTALEVDEHESTTLPLSSSSMCSAGNESVERGYVMVPESSQK